MPQTFEFLTELFEIVDLPIKTRDISTAGGLHRLMPQRRQIKNRQTTVAQSNSHRGIYPGSHVIGASMLKGIRHTQGRVRKLLFALPSSRINVAADPAHNYP